MSIYRSIYIKKPVGDNGGTRFGPDVSVVQSQLNAQMPEGMQKLTVNGWVGPDTLAAIRSFQKLVVDMKYPDGRVDPNGGTLKALNDHASAAKWARALLYPAGPQEHLAEIARPYIGATEASGNRMGNNDPRMREIFEADRHTIDGRTDGYDWCCSFVSLCVQKLIQQRSSYAHVRPPRHSSVYLFRTKWAPDQKCLIFPPSDSEYVHKGDIVVYKESHIGIIDEVFKNMVRAIEGNTNKDGSREEL